MSAEDEAGALAVGVLYSGIALYLMCSYAWWRIQRHLKDRRVPRARVIKER